MRNNLGQLMFMGISGHALTADEKRFIAENNIGGVVLFARNCADPKQIRELTKEIQSLHSRQIDRAPLFVGIDMEGGRVHRLKSPFTQWPALAHIGQIDNATVSFHFTYRMALELRAVGINLDFAPCLDVFSNPRNTVIGDRAVSANASMVEKHASALVRGYIKGGVIPCVKHFPGHGNTLLDSHEDLPIEKVDLDTLKARELIPFKKAFRARADLTMTAHIRYELLDPDAPATLSRKIVTDLLRTELRYRGLCITDDMGMKAITKLYPVGEAAVLALLAGQDLLLYCNDPDAPSQALEGLVEGHAQGRIPDDLILAAHRRVLDFKKAKGLSAELMPEAEALELIGHPEHLRIAEDIRHDRAPEGLLPD